MSKNTYEDKIASDYISSFIRELFNATDNGKLKWDCLNSLSSLSQNKAVTKYQPIFASNTVCSVIFTVDENNGYALEVEFSDKKGFFLELPLNDEHKKHLRVLNDAIEAQIELSNTLKINSQLPDAIQFLSEL